MRIVAICSEEVSDIFLMAGVKDTLIIKSPSKIREVVSSKLRTKDIGIVFIDEDLMPYVKDMIKEKTKGLIPLVITIPGIKAERKIDVIREIVKSTIGFEISWVT